MSNPIHQEVVLKSSPTRVYEALTVAKQFSDATGGAPAEISSEVGGSFSCFGGMIVGRQVELIPNQRVVQAWRVRNWEPGVFSIVRFEIKAQGNETLLVMDHVGFPDGEESHLSPGWQENYLEPLRKYLA